MTLRTIFERQNVDVDVDVIKPLCCCENRFVVFDVRWQAENEKTERERNHRSSIDTFQFHCFALRIINWTQKPLSNTQIFHRTEQFVHIHVSSISCRIATGRYQRSMIRVVSLLLAIFVHFTTQCCRSFTAQCLINVNIAHSLLLSFNRNSVFLFDVRWMRKCCVRGVIDAVDLIDVINRLVFHCQFEFSLLHAHLANRRKNFSRMLNSVKTNGGGRRWQRRRLKSFYRMP